MIKKISTDLESLSFQKIKYVLQILRNNQILFNKISDIFLVMTSFLGGERLS
jgi:hypothetical protein